MSYFPALTSSAVIDGLASLVHFPFQYTIYHRLDARFDTNEIFYFRPSCLSTGCFNIIDCSVFLSFKRPDSLGDAVSRDHVVLGSHKCSLASRNNERFYFHGN